MAHTLYSYWKNFEINEMQTFLTSPVPVTNSYFAAEKKKINSHEYCQC